MLCFDWINYFIIVQHNRMVPIKTSDCELVEQRHGFESPMHSTKYKILKAVSTLKDWYPTWVLSCSHVSLPVNIYKKRNHGPYLTTMKVYKLLLHLHICNSLNHINTQSNHFNLTKPSETGTRLYILNLLTCNAF